MGKNPKSGQKNEKLIVFWKCWVSGLQNEHNFENQQYHYSTHTLIDTFCDFLSKFRKNATKNTTKAGNYP